MGTITNNSNEKCHNKSSKRTTVVSNSDLHDLQKYKKMESEIKCTFCDSTFRYLHTIKNIYCIM